MTYIVGVCGGSASGKTTFCKKVIEMITGSQSGIRCDILSMDCYYKSKTPEELKRANNSEYDFDNPKALDIDKFGYDVARIKKGEVVDVFDYNFTTHMTSTTDFHRYAGS